MSRLLTVIAISAVIAGWAGPVRAQGADRAGDLVEGQAEPAEPAAAAGAAQDEAAAAVAGDSLRTRCEAELRRDDAWRAALRGQLARSILNEAPEPGDAQWRAELKRDLASEVHTEDAQAMLTNKRHVVMAYAALWLLVLVFAVFLWVRQRNLKDEIARLEREIEQATAND